MPSFDLSSLSLRLLIPSSPLGIPIPTRCCFRRTFDPNAMKTRKTESDSVQINIKDGLEKKCKKGFELVPAFPPA